MHGTIWPKYNILCLIEPVFMVLINLERVIALLDKVKTQRGDKGV